MRHEVFINTSTGRRSIVIDSDFCQTLGDVSPENYEGVSLFIASWLSLLSDSPLNQGSLKPYRVYVSFLRRLQTNGFKRTVLDFSDLAHTMVSTIYMSSESSTGDWIDDFKETPVFFEYHRFYQTRDIEILRYLYTFLNFGKKLEYVDPTFEEAAFRSWLDVESRLANLSYNPDDLDAMSKIIRAVLPTFSWSELYPKFGPGSVYERGVRGRLDKIRTLSYDRMIDRFLLHGHIGNYGMSSEHGVDQSKIIPDLNNWSPDKSVCCRNSRLRFVPKNLKTARSICMETNTLMFFQQAVMREFLRLIDLSPLSNFIDIRDQTRNQDLSFIGSYTCDIDTIDLSAASDSVSFELVKRVFPPSWLIPMITTRSKRVRLPNSKFFEVKKFAPMGSALCFPTQCIIFASVCIYAACRYRYDSAYSTQSFSDWLTPEIVLSTCSMFSHEHVDPYVSGMFQPLAVYGDDICVDRRLTQDVFSILDRLGFTVNKGKSFVGGQLFRESCGKFYLDGHDITPLYYRVKGVKSSLGSSHVVSGVHLINEAWNRGYKKLYRFFRHSLTHWKTSKRLRGLSDVNSIPYVSQDSLDFGIYTNSPKNTHLKSRVNLDYQRDEIRCWHISYDKIQKSTDIQSVDFYEHMRWWGSRLYGDTTEPQSSVRRDDTSGARVVWRWMPATE